MTIAERNDKLKHFITCLKCEVSGKCCDVNCSTQYDTGNVGEIIENLEAISKALEQEPCEDAVNGAEIIQELNRLGRNAFKDDTDYDNFFAFVDDSLFSVTPQEPRWIPVSERLPKPFEFVNCTCHSLIDDREDWVVETCYLPQLHNSPYSDWGNIPMLNSCECEVIAWMHRDIPKPYKSESEDKE